MEKLIQIFTIKRLSMYLSISVLIDSVYRKDKNYYPQVFLEKCKYAVKKKMSKFITGDIEISYDDTDKNDSGHSDKEDSDEENSNEES